MRSLLHMPFDPACRMVRLILMEKSLTVRLVPTAPQDSDNDLAAHNPARTVPVLIDEAPSGEELSISPAWAIVDYLEEVYGAPLLLPATSGGRTEVRRLIAWFCDKFDNDIIAHYLRAKIGMAPPMTSASAFDSRAEAIAWHFDYLSWLLEKRHWLAGASFSAADLAGAACFSTLDYFGFCPWHDFPDVKDWYQRVKSRPSFRPLLQERIEGAAPAACYVNLDF